MEENCLLNKNKNKNDKSEKKTKINRVRDYKLYIFKCFM